MSEDDIAIGADREDIDPIDDDNAGAAYVYSVPEPGTVPSMLASLAALAVIIGYRRRF